MFKAGEKVLWLGEVHTVDQYFDTRFAGSLWLRNADGRLRRVLPSEVEDVKRA
jgi:hypothetical protein